MRCECSAYSQSSCTGSTTDSDLIPQGGPYHARAVLGRYCCSLWSQGLINFLCKNHQRLLQILHCGFCQHLQCLGVEKTRVRRSFHGEQPYKVFVSAHFRSTRKLGFFPKGRVHVQERPITLFWAGSFLSMTSHILVEVRAKHSLALTQCPKDSLGGSKQRT